MLIYKYRTVYTILLLVVCTQPLSADSTKPPPPRDDWKGTNFNVARLASVSKEKPFAPPVHAELTPAGFKCSDRLNSAIYRQDVLHAFESYAHFDNCAFKDTDEYIQSLLAQSDKYFRAAPADWKDKDSVPEEILNGMLRLGQVLHAVQDFYAHSNYVELEQKIQPVPVLEQDIPVIDVWSEKRNGAIQSLVNKGLVSGRVWWSLPHRCDVSVATHAEMAKDSAKTPAGGELSIWKRAVGNKHQTNYNVAFSLAHRATREFLQWSGERWPQIEKYCGKWVKYLVIKDRRQADIPETGQ